MKEGFGQAREGGGQADTEIGDAFSIRAYYYSIKWLGCADRVGTLFLLRLRCLLWWLARNDLIIPQIHLRVHHSRICGAGPWDAAPALPAVPAAAA
jgi:hypothetical protein